MPVLYSKEALKAGQCGQSLPPRPPEGVALSRAVAMTAGWSMTGSGAPVAEPTVAIDTAQTKMLRRASMDPPMGMLGKSDC